MKALKFILMMLLFTVIYSSLAYAEWYNPDWGFRREIALSNPGVALDDYQVLLDISYDSDMNYDYSDLRFIASDGVTILPFWIQSYDASSAKVWVKTDVHPGSSSIYVYYGNPSAFLDSSFENTMEVPAIEVASDTWATSGVDVAWSLTQDSQGNIIAGGKGYGGKGRDDMVVMKYSKDLQRLQTIKHGTGYHDRCYGVGVDSQGNYIMAGSGYSGNYFTDMWLVKYSASGSKLWSKFLYGESAQSEITGHNIVVLPDDSFWLVGSDARGSAHQDQIYIGHFDKNGNIIKDKFLNPYPGKYDYGRAIALDTSGNVYISGYINRPNYKGYVAKLDSNLNLVWQKEISGAYRGFLYDLKIYNDEVYITGRIDESTTDFRAILYKYDLDGNIIWEFEYNGPGPSDSFYDLIVDEAGFLLSGTQKDVNNKFAQTLYRFDKNRNHIYTAKADMGSYSGAGTSFVTTGDYVFFQGGYNNVNGPGKHNWHVVKWTERKLADVEPIFNVGEEETGCTDVDGDGFAIDGGQCGPIDCDDSDLTQYPGTTKVTDDNLPGGNVGECQVEISQCDDDGNYYYIQEKIAPVSEVCDNKDNDCNNVVDDVDEDYDEINDCFDDNCLDSVLDFIKLNPNQYGQNGDFGAFEIGKNNDKSLVYDMDVTSGCTCSQIVTLLDAGEGHLTKGCSPSLMEEFTGVSANPDRSLNRKNGKIVGRLIIDLDEIIPPSTFFILIIGILVIISANVIIQNLKK
ncbi:DUF2341 domain-containing protein [Nanoarchaeota archaeon]